MNIEDLSKELSSVAIQNETELEQFRIRFLGSKNILKDLYAALKDIPNDQKRAYGQQVNELKQKAEEIYAAAKAAFTVTQNQSQKEDLSKPASDPGVGSHHPLSLIRREIVEIFNRIGFVVSEGPEIEDDWHNFSALNFPPEHPARDMQDTFFIEKGEQEWALRTHTSSVQVRLMENQKPPIRALMPGRVYRNEAVSSRSNCFFHQIEGLYIDEKVSFADLKQTLYYFVSQFFGEREIRFRPSYFPFTEPSAEMDIFLGTETEQDKRLTKGTGWLEILGCGMVDPNVLKNCGIDPEKYSGFAFGMGIDRITMLKYGIKDIRQMFENDIRFLEQF